MRLPSLPFIIGGLGQVLGRLTAVFDGFVAAHPDAEELTDTVRDELLPPIIEAVGDEDYARKVLAKAWADYRAGTLGRNPHGGGVV